MKILLIAFFATSVQADTPPVPKMFKGTQGQKGQYQVEMLEGPNVGAGKAPPGMTICTDNLMKPPADGAKGGGPKGGDSGCTYKLLKDTYADTQYYQEIIRECGYFATYVGQH